jgi:hypothetical protein
VEQSWVIVLVLEIFLVARQVRLLELIIILLALLVVLRQSVVVTVVVRVVP